MHALHVCVTEKERCVICRPGGFVRGNNTRWIPLNVQVNTHTYAHRFKQANTRTHAQTWHWIMMIFTNSSRHLVMQICCWLSLGLRWRSGSWQTESLIKISFYFLKHQPLQAVTENTCYMTLCALILYRCRKWHNIMTTQCSFTFQDGKCVLQYVNPIQKQ